MNPFILALQARNLTVEIHHHSAYQIVLSNDMPFNSTIDGKLYESIHGFLIKPHVNHFCVAEKGTLNVLNIEPYSDIGLELAGRFKDNEEYIVFDSPSETNLFFQTAKDSLDVKHLIDTLLSKLPAAEYDKRVAKIVEFIKEHYFQSDITPQTFADIIFLSPSRLASLFKQQTGSSLSKYLQYTSDVLNIDCILRKCILRRDRFSFRIGYNRCFIDTVCFLPKCGAVLPDQFLRYIDWHLSKGLYGLNT